MLFLKRRACSRFRDAHLYKDKCYRGEAATPFTTKRTAGAAAGKGAADDSPDVPEGEAAKKAAELAEKISADPGNAELFAALADVLAKVEALQTMDENAVRAIVEGFKAANSAADDGTSIG